MERGRIGWGQSHSRLMKLVTQESELDLSVYKYPWPTPEKQMAPVNEEACLANLVSYQLSRVIISVVHMTSLDLNIIFIFRAHVIMVKDEPVATDAAVGFPVGATLVARWMGQTERTCVVVDRRECLR